MLSGIFMYSGAGRNHTALSVGENGDTVYCAFQICNSEKAAAPVLFSAVRSGYTADGITMSVRPVRSPADVRCAPDGLSVVLPVDVLRL
jgi:hypothetical protein